VILPTEIKPPYSDEVKQQCVDLHTQGYSLERIQSLTGVTNCRRLREWIRQANHLDRPVEPTPELRQRCLNLHADGMSASQIEDLTEFPRRQSMIGSKRQVYSSHVYSIQLLKRSKLLHCIEMVEMLEKLRRSQEFQLNHSAQWRTELI
jgi:hypothetical protein